MKSKNIVILAFVGMALVGALIWWHQKLKASAKAAEPTTPGIVGTRPTSRPVIAGTDLSRPTTTTPTTVASTPLGGGTVVTVPPVSRD